MKAAVCAATRGRHGKNKKGKEEQRLNMQELTDGLRGLSVNEYDWEFTFYTSKKSKDGLAMEFSRCPMKEIGPVVEATVKGLLEKLPSRMVAEYSPFNDKEIIGAVGQTGDLVRDGVQELLNGVTLAFPFMPEDYMTGAAPAPTGYYFTGTKKNAGEGKPERALILKHGNPFIKPGKARLCISSEGEITACVQPVLKFAQTADLLLLGGVCYILAQAAEKDLGMETRPAAICAKRLTVIAESGLVNHYEELENCAYSAKQMRKFVDFDHEVLEYIQRLPLPEREEFLADYGLTMDAEGKLDTGDPERCELLIDLLCGRSCHDALGRLAVASGIVPR